MREGKCGLWFGSSSHSLFTTRECCHRKAAFDHAIGANKLRRLSSSVSIMAVATTFATATRLSGFGRVANGVLRRIF
jgi:hypothetical protein